MVRTLAVKDKIEQINADIDDMRSNPFQYLAGTRPFKSPVEFLELDGPWSHSSRDRWCFDVDKGTIRREVMMETHHAVTTLIKQCFLEAELEHHTKASAKCTKEAYPQGVDRMLS